MRSQATTTAGTPWRTRPLERRRRDGDDVLLGGPGLDALDGGPGDNIIIQD